MTRGFIHSQWLDPRNINATSPDPRIYGEYDSRKRSRMRTLIMVLSALVLAHSATSMAFQRTSSRKRACSSAFPTTPAKLKSQ
jgi:hypothetical protein